MKLLLVNPNITDRITAIMLEEARRCASPGTLLEAVSAPFGTQYVENRAEAAIAWWKHHGEEPRDKLVIFSDGLDVEAIEALSQRFRGRVKASFGWGTMLTNDFVGLVTDDALAPFSLVCKAVSANGRPTVKLSDNPLKAMGPAEEIERYKRVFGLGVQTPRALRV